MKSAYKEFEERCRKEMNFLLSKEGEELQLCLVAQGYSNVLLYRWMVLLGSGFSAIKIINNLREKIK